jgi:threonine/homoserine/homoserine lactone efflux protein
VLSFFLIGATVGVISGVPIGPVNLAVIDAAFRHGLRRALMVGLGGALGDGVYALVGIVAMGPILSRYPVVSPVLYAVSGVGLFLYAIKVLRSQPQAPLPKPSHLPRSVPVEAPMWSAFLGGLGLVLINPAAIVTWVIIVGLFMHGATPANGVLAALGVVVGSFAWFTGVAHVTEHGKDIIGDKTIKITRVVAYLILGYSMFAVGRALHYWLF